MNSINLKKNRIRNVFNNKIDRAVLSFKMFKQGDSVLVGVSGGPDSTALLHALYKIAPKWSLKLGAAHLNHGLRFMESDADAVFTESMVKSFGLPFYTEKTDVDEYRKVHKLSLEEAARDVRYNYFNRVAKKYGYQKIALGHHGDDNAELLLMYLIRGSGPLGISGIPPVRGNRIVRPLILLTRSEILSYLDSENIEFIIDSSNADVKILRNKIRTELIPTIRETYNPKIIQSLNRLTDIVRSEEEWVESLVDSMFSDVIVSSGKGYILLSVSRLSQIHFAANRRIIRRAISAVKGDLRRIRYSHIHSCLELMEGVSHYGRLDLPDRIQVRRNHNVIGFYKEKESLRSIAEKSAAVGPLKFQYDIPKPGDKPETVYIKEAGVFLKLLVINSVNFKKIRTAGQSAVFFNMESLLFPLILRNIEPGDRFTPFGMKGSQKVKKFFVDHKISREHRPYCPVLLSGDKILWVVGYRQSEYCKVSSSNINVLKIELNLA